MLVNYRIYVAECSTQFVRDSNKKEKITEPYTYLGEADYVRNNGSTPISFI